jgi:hypothetical protein
MAFLRRFVSLFALAAILLPAFAETPQQPSPQQQPQQQSKPKCTDTAPM